MNDLLLCFSDGVIESNDESGQQLGVQGVLEIVQSLDASQPEQLISQLLAKIGALHEDNLRQDDVTVFLIRATGTGPSLKDNLLAPFRFVTPVRDRTALAAS